MNMRAVLAAVSENGRVSNVPMLERANDTTCVNVIDKDGNMFSATPSGAWLPAVVAGGKGGVRGGRLRYAPPAATRSNDRAPRTRTGATVHQQQGQPSGAPHM